MQERPPEAPPAKTHSKKQGGRRLCPVQLQSNTVPGSMDGCPPNVQRASQPLHKEGQGSRRPTAHSDEDTLNRPGGSQSHSGSLHSSGYTRRQRIMVRPERNWQTRGCSTPPESAGQVNPVRPAHDTTRSAHERSRAETCARSPRLHAAKLRGEARKCMLRPKAKGDVQAPHIWCTNIQSHQERGLTRP